MYNKVVLILIKKVC